VSRAPLVSVIIPTLDEAGEIAAVLDHLAGLGGRFEVIVADGGSTDETVALARGHGSHPRVVQTHGGRARQLNDGAAQAGGELLVFLHADSRLPDDAHVSLAAALRDPRIRGGNFVLRFDGADRFSRTLSRWYAVQRRAGIYYGDSAVWVRRAAFEGLGGYRPLPIMDDYDFVRRLERSGATVCLPGPALTSARRWQQAGVARTVGSWVVIRWLYLAGVPPRRLARAYRIIR